MAKAKVNYYDPNPIESIDLSLTQEEAEALYSVLCTISVKGVGKTTYKIFSALSEVKVIENIPLTPTVPPRNYGAPLIVFKEIN